MFKYIFIRFLAIVVIPCLFLVVLECGLRLAGTGHSTRFYVKIKQDDTIKLIDNNKFGWLFFPSRISRNLESFNVAQQKPENSFRILVLGASAAQGVPKPDYSFGRILEYQLNEQYTGIDFEVITLAMPAINSHVVRRIIRDAHALDPDMYLVYLGNNEVAGPYGAGTAFSDLIESSLLIQTSLAAKSTYLGQFMKTILGNLAHSSTAPQEWKGLEMFLDKQVRAHDPKLDIVFDHFENNLQYIANRAAKKEVPIIFSTLAGNWRNCAPFASLHREDISAEELSNWNALYKKGIQAETDRNFSAALEAYQAAIAIDNEFAELHFRIARCFENTGDMQAAKDAYGKALFYDTIRLRSELRTNQTIRNVVQNSDSAWVHSIDTERVFKEQSSNKIQGSEFLLEHVHLNFRGNYLLAQTFYEEIEKILPEAIIHYNLGLIHYTQKKVLRHFQWNEINRLLWF